MATSSNLGTAGDKGPEGEQGPPGHSPLYELGQNEPCWIPNALAIYEGTPMYWGEKKVEELTRQGTITKSPGISLQDIISSEKVAATETGAVVRMPQEFDAKNLKAYIQQEIEAGIKEHETRLMRMVSNAVADTIVEERNLSRTNHDRLVRTIHNLETLVNFHRTEANERALDIAELQIKVAELEGRLEEKTQETKLLRKQLHTAKIKKSVRKIRRKTNVSTGQSTPEPGPGGSTGG